VTPASCPRCGTELSFSALACPACGALVHADQLKRLAAEADTAQRAGDLIAARDRWTAMLPLLPSYSQQHAAISARVAALTTDVAPPSSGQPPAARDDEPRWRQGAAGLATLAVVLASKLKFLLLGLTKASTFVSMFAFFGVYWSVYGWPLALGLVVAIYIHEMGHVSMLRHFRIDAGAPLFIPGVGALVMLKQRISDPRTDARIGLAGPVWGLGAALAALLVYLVTRAPIWLAIAQLTGFINLFNLIPVWQLDGSRGLHALARWQRWTLVATVAVALMITEQRLLFVIGAVAVWRSLERDEGPGDRRILATYVTLVLALALISRSVR
jgi:Zn-dependent protease